MILSAQAYFPYLLLKVQSTSDYRSFVALNSRYRVLNLVYLFWPPSASAWVSHIGLHRISGTKTSPRIDFNLGVALKIPLTYCSEQGYHPHLGLPLNDPRYPCLLALRDSWVWFHITHIPCASWFAL